ncbi:type ISP restriction/modification enzyme [Candidatus Poriferisodalis sp.]|uniref:type ISP restriction/modification enzyme n=1 Tax=Candidatus Poriferisodalis sp. TaxID=3101277 RepID=UPI003B01C066
MTDTLNLGLEHSSADGDNVTDWCLEQFRSHYRDDTITKDDIWEYLYGVMHAPDWRKRYHHDLQRNLPRVPLAPDFEAFRSAGRELMDLHIGHDEVPEYPVDCLLDGVIDNDGAADPLTDPDAYRIAKLAWGKASGNKKDRSVMEISPRCRIVGIPEPAHEYTISGRSPLQWAIDSLRHKHDKKSGITDDPNHWEAWADEPFNLIRHLRRLVMVSVESARIIAALPPSLDPA